jgi:nicotinamide mononucleotide transporter
MTAFFCVETVFVTLFGYPMSYLELTGTVFNLWSVWLVARKNILTWPVGVVGVILFAILFYQIQLYSDLVESPASTAGGSGGGPGRG